MTAICPVCNSGRDQTLSQAPTGAGSNDATPLPAKPSLQPGQVLDGFEVLEEINHGGMGVIYKARQQGLNRLVALKVITPDRLGCADALRRFQREVQAAALLSHPNIVTVYHTALTGPWPYLAMEYVAGIDLFRLVQRSGPLPVARALDYVVQTAHGLQHAHEQGLVHRDIKPANLMVTPSPLDTPPRGASRVTRVKILDLGLARVMTPMETEGSLTQAGVFLGTPDYIAPEQAEDPRNADVRSDLYSLGCTLYFLLIGEVPFPGGNLVQRIRRQLTEPTPSIARRRDDVSPELDAIAARLIAREPVQRFQSPAELIDALEGLQHARPVSASPPPQAPRSTPAATPVATPTPVTVRDIPAHAGGVRALCLSADGRWLISGGVDETLRLWATDRLREVLRVGDGVGPVEDVSLVRSGKWAASCALRLFREDMVVQLWDLASRREIRRLKGCTDGVHCVAISADGRRVAAGCADRMVRIWALDQRGAAPLCMEGHSGPVSRVVYLPGGNSLFSAGHDDTVRLWDAATGAAKGSFSAGVGPIRALAVWGGGKRIAVGGENIRLRRGNSPLVPLGGHRGPVLCLAFSADGQLLLSGGSDGTVRIWRVADGEELHTLETRAGKIHAVAIHPEGRTAFLGFEDGILRRWPLPDLHVV
jgi:serine/threonine protein kinase